jgi:hypothetical protein
MIGDVSESAGQGVPTVLNAQRRASLVGVSVAARRRGAACPDRGDRVGPFR